MGANEKLIYSLLVFALQAALEEWIEKQKDYCML